MNTVNFLDLPNLRPHLDSSMWLKNNQQANNQWNLYLSLKIKKFLSNPRVAITQTEIDSYVKDYITFDYITDPIKKLLKKHFVSCPDSLNKDSFLKLICGANKMRFG